MTAADNTTVAQEIFDVDDESSLLSNSYGESVGVNEFMAMKYDQEEDSDEDGDNSDGLEICQPDEEAVQNGMFDEHNFNPPGIRRMSSENKLIQGISEKGIYFSPSV